MVNIGDCVYIQAGNNIEKGVIYQLISKDPKPFYLVRTNSHFIEVPEEQCYTTINDCVLNFNQTYSNKFDKIFQLIQTKEDLIKFLFYRLTEDSSDKFSKEVAILAAAKFGIDLF